MISVEYVQFIQTTKVPLFPVPRT